MLNKKDFQKVDTMVNKLGWSVYNDEDGCITFNKHSPAGQDFNVTVEAGNLDKLSENLEQRYEDFDTSYETYIWLDNTGHGTNGAPYDMGDLYNDMEECKKMLKELSDEIKKRNLL